MFSQVPLEVNFAVELLATLVTYMYGAVMHFVHVLVQGSFVFE